ncbi:MAG: hypothetical protein A3F67_11960 [Verrucomicrobia bacterium RIFCSPHIGHO2_12_FULL_41_10]|nr:MAG: hypothetical protein A3F67_11960 [Verrucomicrobia bacterium RIFCSPHIGHO2_12_FULL_41_10]
MHLRKKEKELFLEGEYLPLKTPESTIAFLRRWKNREVIIAARRFQEKKREKEHFHFLELQNRKWKDLFTDEILHVHKEGVSSQELFPKYPFAIWLPC